MSWEYLGNPGLPPDCHDARCFGNGDLRAFVSRDGDEKFWHLSIAHPSRYPTWDEIKKARYELMPDEITVGMILPPKSEYVNIDSNCFHLHEIRANIHRTGIIRS